MNTVIALYRSTIGKKLAMALSGVAYIGWVLFHMVGNMSFHLGSDAINAYAHKLQEMPPLVWGGRSFLLLALIVHVVSAFSLIAQNNKARGKSYKGPKKTYASTAASKSMRYGGIALLLFIIWHLLDFTVGVFSPLHSLVNVYEYADLGFARGEVYHNMLISFGNPISAGIYVIATVFLSLHLYHGAWSAVQTVGIESATTGKFWRSIAGFVAGLVLIGNLSFPVLGFAGTAGGFLEAPPTWSYCGYYDSCPASVTPAPAKSNAH
ncbi:MAG: succinate dehydrogenase cytochrome b subunit [Myxococcota bacterium]